jgi:anaerobic magnesium-protoporphyrin IX monomethyl ester cyclase
VKVFLGNAPWYEDGLVGVRAGSRWPHLQDACDPYLPFPFYLGYATAILEQTGYECLLVDGIAERISTEEFVKRCVEYKPDFVLLEVSTASIRQDLETIRGIKAGLPGVPVGVAGLLPEAGTTSFLDGYPEIDYAFQGEYEFTLLEVIQALDAGGIRKDHLGLTCRDEEGKVIVNARRPLEKDINQFPWPARKHLPMLKYHDLPGGIPGPSLQMWASRGCPFHCTFCAWPQIMYGGDRYRTRDPIDIVDEIEAMVKEYGYKSAYFDDDTFNLGKKRMMKMADEMIRRKLNIPWAIMARADTSDEETLAKMKEAGLMSVKFGVESASQEIIDRCEKGLDLSRVENAVKTVKRLGINLHLTFTFGLLGETRETIRQTINFAKKLDPDSIQFSIATPFPGSKLYHQMEERDYLVTKDWEMYDGGNKAVVRTEQLSPQDLEIALRTAYDEWQRHKLLRPFRSPKEWKKFLRSPATSLRKYRNEWLHKKKLARQRKDALQATP